ncbi:MAG: AAA family ATPase [Puniceicoccales bacterium]|jgi:hypothetical protein|nr:AAA family ATPase [Puniceicoccales bacterium]
MSNTSTTTQGHDNAELPRIATKSKSLADMERDIVHYPDPIRNATAWLQGFYLDHCRRNLNVLRSIACKAGHDKSVPYFYNVMGGQNFKGGPGEWKENGRAWSEFLTIVEALRRYEQQTVHTGKIPFIETPTYQCIADFITAKRAISAVCKIGGITGATGGQKSACFKQYRLLNNHGAVIHIEAPANGRLTMLKRKIAEAYHVNSFRISHQVDTAIREQVNEARCIIIDNAQVLYSQGRGGDQPAFNWLREMQDDTNCTIILSFTTDFVDILTAGRAQGYFEQFIGRMGGVAGILRLPEYAETSDLRVIAKAFGLLQVKGAMDLVRKWSRREGRIRIVFEKLQLAQTFARAEGREKIALEDLADADEYIPQAFRSDSEGGDE